MNKRSSAAYLALFLGLSVTLAGCGYMNQIRAMKAFKDGNKAYAASDWREAVAKYEEAAQLTYRALAAGRLENLRDCPEQFLDRLSGSAAVSV